MREFPNLEARHPARGGGDRRRLRLERDRLVSLVRQHLTEPADGCRHHHDGAKDRDGDVRQEAGKQQRHPHGQRHRKRGGRRQDD